MSTKMVPEIKEVWLAKLRSGEYTQGRRSLKVSDFGVTRHCCLGVLCEVYNEDIEMGQWIGTEGVLQHKPLDGIASTFGYPAEPVLEWAGLSYYKILDLSVLNDASDNFDSTIQYIQDNL